MLAWSLHEVSLRPICNPLVGTRSMLAKWQNTGRSCAPNLTSRPASDQEILSRALCGERVFKWHGAVGQASVGVPLQTNSGSTFERVLNQILLWMKFGGLICFLHSLNDTCTSPCACSILVPWSVTSLLLSKIPLVLNAGQVQICWSAGQVPMLEIQTGYVPVWNTVSQVYHRCSACLWSWHASCWYVLLQKTIHPHRRIVFVFVRRRATIVQGSQAWHHSTSPVLP